MPDDAQYISAAIARAFRRKLDDETITLDAIKAYADSALAKLAAGTTVIQLNLEGGGGSSVVNCHPSILLEACETVIKEQSDEVGFTGATDIDLSKTRIES